MASAWLVTRHAIDTTLNPGFLIEKAGYDVASNIWQAQPRGLVGAGRVWSGLIGSAALGAWLIAHSVPGYSVPRRARLFARDAPAATAAAAAAAAAEAEHVTGVG
jgi:hypothetical protein